jgi:TolB protein
MVQTPSEGDVASSPKEDRNMKNTNAFLALTLIAALATPCLAQEVASTLSFTSTRDNPSGLPQPNFGEIYLIDVLTDGTFSEARRLTENEVSDFFPTFSPDGKGRIIFDSNERRADGEPINVSDLFLMNHVGGGRRFLTRGGSPSWAPGGPNGAPSKTIAFHRSASGTGRPVLTTPASATTDSDIFVASLEDLENGIAPQNITNHPNVDDDPDWSNDGQKIIFTSHDANDNHQFPTTTDIYVMNPDGSGRTQLTVSTEEERAPAFSPDDSQILYMCRRGDFEICVMNADGSDIRQLTFNTVGDFTPSWSPDGERILFHRALGLGQGNQLFVMDKNGLNEQQLTTGPGINLLANWGAGKVNLNKD